MNIANHGQEQMEKWEALCRQYELAIDEVLGTSGKLSPNSALHLRDAFLAYKDSLGLQGGALNNLEAAMGAWIDENVN